MKNIVILKISLFSIVNYTFSQCITTIPTPNGDVIIELQVVDIEAPEECNNGYGANPIIQYSVTTPDRLYTLQARVICGSNSAFFDLPNNGGSGQVKASNFWVSDDNCNEVTPAMLNCTTIELKIHGKYISEQTIMVDCEDILPIDLTYFNVENMGSHVKIMWETAEETESVFYLEHSDDGKSWETITSINNKGSYSSYAYRHYNFL